EEEEPEPLQRLLERLGGALERPAQGRRQVQLALQLLYFGYRIAERESRPEVEGDRHGRELAQMVDGERSDSTIELRYRAERHQFAGLRTDVQQRERLRITLVFRQQLHHHPVLIARRVDGRDLRSAVRAVERVLDLVRRHAKGR